VGNYAISEHTRFELLSDLLSELYLLLEDEQRSNVLLEAKVSMMEEKLVSIKQGYVL